MRKVLNNYNKSKHLHGTTKGKIGTVLKIKDKHNKYLTVGDTVKYGKYKGILLYEYISKRYGLALFGSMQFGEDPYDIDSYGKFIEVPMDGGAKLELEICNT